MQGDGLEVGAEPALGRVVRKARHGLGQAQHHILHHIVLVGRRHTLPARKATDEFLVAIRELGPGCLILPPRKPGQEADVRGRLGQHGGPLYHVEQGPPERVLSVSVRFAPGAC